MTSLQTALTIITVGLAASIAFLVAAFIKKSQEMKFAAYIMLLCPPAGVIYFIGGTISRKLMKKERDMQLDDIGFSKARRNRIIRPDVETESQAVPFEEVLLVSTDLDKRRHLLSQLKMDNIDNYLSIKKALDNSDPETSHYAASALTSAKSDFENVIRELESAYAKNRSDRDLVRRYADFMTNYLNSGILDPMEERKYSFQLINILTGVEGYENFLTEQDYSNIVDRAVYTGDFQTAARWAEIAGKSRESEFAYLSLLKAYYYTNRTEDFFNILNEMKKSDIQLSEEGLSLVRYFAGAKRA